MKIEFPFSAVVAQDDLKLALVLISVDPTIGGVLITGERGTAKTTAARGIASLLPKTSSGNAAPFVELPLGATEDRVVGSLDISRVLQDGRTELRSGLLAQAHGGVLYVDEVNLLPDHIVDLLLDAAATGWVTVERDGISATEDAQFILVGTMNPEEGELRPQFVDRFGLCVAVHGLVEEHERTAAIRQRLSFDDNPAALVERAQPAEHALRERIVVAREQLKSVSVSDAHLSNIARISVEHHLDGIRGDLAIVKAARALAAWEGADQIEDEHIKRAAELAVSHRTRKQKAARQPRRRPQPTGNDGGRLASAEDSNVAARGADGPSPQPASLAPAPASDPLALELSTKLVDMKRQGRRGVESQTSRRVVGAGAYDDAGTLDMRATMVAAAGRGARVSESGIKLTAPDLRRHERRGPGRAHVLFVVDASGSMATHRRLEAAKGAALGLLTSSYQRRDEVALMVFRGEGADLVLPFTRHVASIEQVLKDVPTGGRTPLARALIDASELLKSREPSLCVLFTDGRANVGTNGGDPWQEALSACAALRSSCAGALVIDCELGPVTLGRAGALAKELGADCVPLDTLDTDALTLHIHRRLESL
jgi:magnesium chelatase subunit D